MGSGLGCSGFRGCWLGFSCFLSLRYLGLRVYDASARGGGGLGLARGCFFVLVWSLNFWHLGVSSWGFVCVCVVFVGVCVGVGVCVCVFSGRFRVSGKFRVFHWGFEFWVCFCFFLVLVPLDLRRIS